MNYEPKSRVVFKPSDEGVQLLSGNASLLNALRRMLVQRAGRENNCGGGNFGRWLNRNKTRGSMEDFKGNDFAGPRTSQSCSNRSGQLTQLV